MPLVEKFLDKLADPAGDLVFLDHAAEILQKRGHMTAARAVAAIVKYERTRGERGGADNSRSAAPGRR